MTLPFFTLFRVCSSVRCDITFVQVRFRMRAVRLRPCLARIMTVNDCLRYSQDYFVELASAEPDTATPRAVINLNPLKAVGLKLLRTG